MNKTLATAPRGLVSVQGAAAALGCSRYTVYRMIHSGRLHAARVGGSPKAPWVIDGASVEELAKVATARRVWRWAA